MDSIRTIVFVRGMGTASNILDPCPEIFPPIQPEASPESLYPRWSGRPRRHWGNHHEQRVAADAHEWKRSWSLPRSRMLRICAGDDSSMIQRAVRLYVFQPYRAATASALTFSSWGQARTIRRRRGWSDQ
jgi:hypothetical protein